MFRCARAGDPCGKIRAVKSRVARLFGCSAVWALCACGDKPTEVELRLFPCVSAPTSVSLTIQSYGEGGEKIGAPLAKTFRIDDQGVFDDGFATVGFTPPEGTLHADITVVWSTSGEEVQARYNAPVRRRGEAIELGADQCEDDPGTTTMMSTTLETTTTEATTDAETTETTSTSTETTSTSTTETTTDPSETTTTTGTSETSTTDSTTGTTGEEPVEGGDCAGGGAVCTAGPGEIGKLLQCINSKWVESYDGCAEDACEHFGFDDPVIVGCTGDVAWGCVCAPTPKEACSRDMKSKCGEVTDAGQLVDLCVEDGDDTWHYAAICSSCKMVDDQPLCVSPPP